MNQQFLMFKSNPFKQQFLNYQHKTIKTLEIHNFTFINPTQTQIPQSNINKIHIKKYTHKHINNLSIFTDSQKKNKQLKSIYRSKQHSPSFDQSLLKRNNSKQQIQNQSLFKQQINSPIKQIKKIPINKQLIENPKTPSNIKNKSIQKASQHFNKTKQGKNKNKYKDKDNFIYTNKILTKNKINKNQLNLYRNNKQFNQIKNTPSFSFQQQKLFHLFNQHNNNQRHIIKDNNKSHLVQSTINPQNNTFDNDLKIKNQHNFKQKLYQSIDFDHIFEKIQSQVTHFDTNKSPQNSPIIKDKLLLLDKMKRYSKTPNSKARTVFDQFNLKYLINKRKNFNLKNQSHIKGSHLPYFQSFSPQQIKNISKLQKKHQLIYSVQKTHNRNSPNLSIRNNNSPVLSIRNNSPQFPRNNSPNLLRKSPDLLMNSPRLSRKSPNLSQNQIDQSRRKKSSYIVIDDNGIVHEQNPQYNTKDRLQMIQKISGKVINIRQMLKIQKNQPEQSS